MRVICLLAMLMCIVLFAGCSDDSSLTAPPTEEIITADVPLIADATKEAPVDPAEAAREAHRLEREEWERQNGGDDDPPPPPPQRENATMGDVKTLWH